MDWLPCEHDFRLNWLYFAVLSHDISTWEPFAQYFSNEDLRDGRIGLAANFLAHWLCYGMNYSWHDTRKEVAIFGLAETDLD